MSYLINLIVMHGLIHISFGFLLALILQQLFTVCMYKAPNGIRILYFIYNRWSVAGLLHNVFEVDKVVESARYRVFGEMLT